MAFWDFLSTLGSSNTPSWSKGVGLFGSVLADIGAGMQGRPDVGAHLANYLALQRQRAGQQQVADLFGRIAPPAGPPLPPMHELSRGPASPANNPDTGPLSQEDLLRRLMQLKASNPDVDVSAPLAYIQATQRPQPTYGHAAQYTADGRAFIIGNDGSVQWLPQIDDPDYLLHVRPWSRR